MAVVTILSHNLRHSSPSFTMSRYTGTPGQARGRDLPDNRGEVGTTSQVKGLSSLGWTSQAAGLQP
jgi:hypothetical protein